MAGAAHIPVLLTEVVAALAPAPGRRILDATFGGGGYSAAFLAAGATVTAVDRDPAAIARGQALAAANPGRLTLIEGRFGDLDRLVAGRVQAVAFDLGVSSPQIDDPARGFSFRLDGPLDMRMGDGGPSAADLVAELDEQTLAEAILRYGEERHARRVARAIVAARAEAPILTTGRLAAIVRSAVPRAGDGIDPATRTFQALRILVNQELEELDHGLSAAERLLDPGGRLAVVSFHSLEDRAVKQFLRRRSGADAAPSRHAPPVPSGPAPSFRLIGRRPVEPGPAEIAANPRSRSARLRVAERTDAPAWPAGEARQ
ncbi:MAG: 16S rRNA (cytosine(1402)-N(4))-methyltransferase RsmH [Thalassobaculales bacterium]